VEKDIHRDTPNAAFEYKQRINGGFEAQLDRHIREQDTSIERERIGATEMKTHSPVPSLNKSKSGRERLQSGHSGDQGYSADALRPRRRDSGSPYPGSEATFDSLTPSRGPTEDGASLAAPSGAIAVGERRPSSERMSSRGGVSSKREEVRIAEEERREEERREEAQEREFSEGDSSGDERLVHRRAEEEKLPKNVMIDEKEVLRRRRRRRKQQAPDYIEYAKRREAQLNASEDRTPMGLGPELWVVDHPKYTGPDDGRDEGEAITQGRPKSPKLDSPFTKMPQDILQPQKDKDQIGVHYKWEDIMVSNHTVLRTALPTSPPRVPQLLVSAAHADARPVHDLGSTYTTQVTRPTRSLVGDIYATETAHLGSDDAMLGGAAPSDFTGLEDRIATPPRGARSPKREAQREKLKAQKMSKGSKSDVPQLDVVLQRRLEIVWDIMQVPPMNKLDHVLKYSKVEYSTKLPDSLLVWEAIAQCVQRREQLLRELNNLKNSNSALKGSKAVRERMSRLAVALCEHTRDCLQLITQLQDEFDDEVEYNGTSYELKIQADLDDELIGMLPENYVYSDLLRREARSPV